MLKFFQLLSCHWSGDVPKAVETDSDPFTNLRIKRSIPPMVVLRKLEGRKVVKFNQLVESSTEHVDIVTIGVIIDVSPC